MLKIVGVHSGLYDVLDTDDGKVESVTASELLICRASGIDIKGCYYTESGLVTVIDKAVHKRSIVSVPEIWKPITVGAVRNAAGGYLLEASNLGNFRKAGFKYDGSVYSPKKVIFDTVRKYLCECSGVENEIIKADWIVALTFIPKRGKGIKVMRLDGNRYNNRVDNLIWCKSDVDVSPKKGSAMQSAMDVYGVKSYKESAPDREARIMKMHDINERPIRQYSVDGFLIREHQSCQHASEYVSTWSASSIRKCCLRLPKFDVKYNSIWRFADDDEFAITVESTEEWRPIRLGYEVSRTGNVRKVFDNGYAFVKQEILHGQPFVALWGSEPDKEFVDILVANAFIDNPNLYHVVRHLDGDMRNNNADNLEWIYSNKTVANSGKVVRQYTVDGQYITSYDSISQACRANGFLQTAGVSSCCNRKPGHNSRFGFIWRFAEDDELFETAPKYKEGVGTIGVAMYSEDVVRQYDPDGKFIAEYSSASEAGRCLGYAASGISKCCSRKCELSHGYVWRYKADDELFALSEAERKAKIYKRRVLQYTLNMELVAEYLTCVDAERATGVYADSISECCRGAKGRRTAGNFIWKYSTVCKE